MNSSILKLEDSNQVFFESTVIANRAATHRSVTAVCQPSLFVHSQGRQPFASLSAIKVKYSQRRQKGRLTVEVEEMLVMADLGYVSGRHGVRGGNQSTQAGSPQFVRTQRVLLGFIMWRECTGLFCNNTYRNETQAAFRAANCQFLCSQMAVMIN